MSYCTEIVFRYRRIGLPSVFVEVHARLCYTAYEIWHLRDRFMEDSALKKSILSGFLWKAVENGGDQIITFVISLILARILGPSRYGTMSVMLIFIAIANVIIQTGFQTALIQKKDVDETDFHSVLWLSLGVSAVLYAAIFGLAPVVAGYFKDPEITPMLRVLSLMLFSGAVTSVLLAHISRQMDFRTQCIATVIADVIAGAAGIAAAVLGAGTWALVIQQLSKSVLLAVILWRLLSWKAERVFSLEKVKSLFAYGWKVLVSGLIDTIYTNLYTPVISRLYNAEMVGLYTRANQFPQVIANSAAMTMQSVLLPTFSKTQDDRESTRVIMKRTLKVSGYIIFPAMFGIMAVAEPMVRVLLGDEWMGAVALLRLCCLSFSVWHIHIANLQAINASGRSDIYLKLEIVKKAIGVLVLVLSVRWGVVAMIFMKALFDYVCTFINAWPNRKLCGYGPIEQWKDMLPEFLTAGTMAVCAWAAGRAMSLAGLSAATFGTALLVMIVQIIAGMAVYAGLSAAFKLESFRFLVETVKGVRKK